MNPTISRPISMPPSQPGSQQTKITNFYQPTNSSKAATMFGIPTGNSQTSIFSKGTTSNPPSPIQVLKQFNTSAGNSANYGSSMQQTYPMNQMNQQQLGQWRQLPLQRKIRVDARQAAWTIDPATRKQGNYSVFAQSYREQYRKSYMSANQIRMFTYLQKAGLLTQYLVSGYASEAVEKIGKANKLADLFGQNRSGATNGPFGSTSMSQSSYNGSTPGIFSGMQQKGPFGQQNQGNSSVMQGNTSFTQGTSPFGQNIGGSIGNSQGNTGIFSQQNTNIFNIQQQQQQTNPFNQLQANPFAAQNRLPEVQYNPQVVQGMKGPVIEQMGQALMQGKMYPLLGEFLQSYGIDEKVLEHLFRMGLEITQIQQFLARRYFLRRICQEQAQKMNFLSDYYLQAPGAPKGMRTYQQPLSFPHFSKYPNSNDKFSMYVDYIMEHSQYTWQQRMLHEAWKEYLKENISPDPYRQQMIRELLDDLENMDQEEFVARQYNKREERIQMSSRQSEQQQGRRVWASDEAIQNQGLNRVPMRIKPYYLD